MTQPPLFIVESENKANMLRQLAGAAADCVVIRTPPVKVELLSSSHDLPGNKGEDFTFTLNRTEEHLAKLLEQRGDSPVYLALDGDSKGRYWDWLLQNYIKVHHPAVNCLVLALRGLTPAEFAEAMEEAGMGRTATACSIHIRSLFFNRLGGHLQRLIGTQYGPNKLHLNFDSLTTLFLMQSRDDENRMYSPLLQWHAAARLKVAGRELWAECKGRANGSDTGLESEEQFRMLEKQVLSAGFSVTKIDKRKLSLSAPAPYLLAELLQEANSVHGLSPKAVLHGLRKLFHGHLHKETGKGLISWYLPGNGIFSDETLDNIDGQVVAEFGENTLAGKLPYVADGAILALWPEVPATALGEVLSGQEQELYEMIRLRTLASRMRVAVGQRIVCTLEGGGYVFEVSDQQIDEEGFLVASARHEEQRQQKESPLAQMQEGQAIPVAELRCEQKSLYPPEPYTFETLFADLADFSVTVDDTLVLMLQFMMDAGYIALEEGGFLRPLSSSMKVVSVLNRVFPAMQGTNLSAYLEQTAEEVISGRKALAAALQQFDQTLQIHGKPLASPAVSAAALAALQKKRQARASSSVIKTVAEIPAGEPASKTPEPDRQPTPAEEKVSSPLDNGEILEKEASRPLAQATPDVPAATELSEGPISLEPQPAPQEGEEFLGEGEGHAGETAEEEEGVAVQPEMGEETHSAPLPDIAFSAEAKQSAERLTEEPDPFTEQIPPEPSEPARPLPMAASLADGEKQKSTPCPVCGRPLVSGRDQYGQFYTCSGFPACRYAESEQSADQERMRCPVCAKGEVHSKTTPTGKRLYVCSGIDCEFMAWAKPHPVTCPSCGSPFLVEKKQPSGAVELRCPRAGCNFRQPYPSPGGKVADVGLVEASGHLKKKVKVKRVGSGLPAAGGKKRVVRVVRRRK